MMPKPLALIGRDSLTAFLVRDYFNLPKKEALISALLTRGLGQADLVLCLLRLRDASKSADHKRILTHYIHLMVGKRIAIGTPCLQHYRKGPLITDIRQPRITFVTKANPRYPNTGAHQRFQEFKVGRTEEEVRKRGLSRRDVREAVNAGWIKFDA